MTTDKDTNEITPELVKKLLDGINGDGSQTSNVHKFIAAAPAIARAYLETHEQLNQEKRAATVIIDKYADSLKKNEESQQWADLADHLKEENQRLQSIIDGQRSALENVDMPDYWQEVVGVDRYTGKHYGKRTAAHPTIVKKVMAEVTGTPAADVIVGLIYEIHIVRQREKWFIEELREKEKSLALTAKEGE